MVLSCKGRLVERDVLLKGNLTSNRAWSQRKDILFYTLFDLEWLLQELLPQSFIPF